jgi:hypothetical protein
MSSPLARNERSHEFSSLEERVRKAIHQLSILTRGATLEFALGVGRIVVDTLYDGDLTAWRSRARKDCALRVLVSNPNLPMSASALYRALAIYELSRRQLLAAGWQHLGVSHLRTVLGLPSDTQNRLLTRAEAEQWTVARLEREVLGLRAPQRTTGGRKPVPACIKSIRRIFDLTLPDALAGLDHIQELQASELDELVDKLSQARERLHRIERILSSGSSVCRSTRASRASSGQGCSLRN